jgi:hypothetical protein
MPLRWHRWMINDLLGPGWRRRFVLTQSVLGLVAILLAFFMITVTVHASFPLSSQSIVGGASAAVGMFLGVCTYTRRNRDRLLARHE